MKCTTYILQRIITFFVISFAVSLNASSYPIDIVYTWVDGKDRDWLAAKEHYLDLELVKQKISAQQNIFFNAAIEMCNRCLAIDSASKNRFEDHEELRYSLRSLLLYAPWFNHVYVITAGHKPEWFISHPRITFIEHAKIFEHAEDLPTFNSHAIESNLHRIPNLSEHFLYFNDDVFLGSSVSPSDFFTENGNPIVLFEKGGTISTSEEVNATLYRKAWRNTNAYLDEKYKIEKRNRLCHAPFALRISYILFSEREFPQFFALNASHRFRSEEDYNITNGLLQYHWNYYNMIEKNFGISKNKMVTIYPDALLAQTLSALELLQGAHLQSFCLQDMMDESSSLSSAALRNFLESRYPTVAPWEIESLCKNH